jgi:hypothetical protein
MRAKKPLVEVSIVPTPGDSLGRSALKNMVGMATNPGSVVLPDVCACCGQANALDARNTRKPKRAFDARSASP